MTAAPKTWDAGVGWYVHPITGLKLPGVTSILGSLPKPFLADWAAKMAAEWAVDNLAVVSALDPEAAVELIKGASKRYSTKAAKAGTEAHRILEDLARHRPAPDGYVKDAWIQFTAAYVVEVVETEATAWHPEAGYAGTLDALAYVDGVLTVLDWKTGKSVYPEAAVQLEAYRDAPTILDADGTERRMPEIGAAAVLHVRPDGWKLVPQRRPPRGLFEQIRGVWSWSRTV